MSIKHNLEQWVAQLDYDDTCDISDRQVSELIRGYSALEAKCAALAAELKQSQIDAGCYKHGMEASNARLVQVAAEGAALKEYLAPVGLSVEGTPATDAILAEVRAISLENFADVMAEIGHYDAANHATKHAHKIRQEADQ